MDAKVCLFFCLDILFKPILLFKFLDFSSVSSCLHICFTDIPINAIDHAVFEHSNLSEETSTSSNGC